WRAPKRAGNFSTFLQDPSRSYRPMQVCCPSDLSPTMSPTPPTIRCHLPPIDPMTARRILVTSALPYANGPIHIGHLGEYIQTDIWVRFQKLIGNRCVYVCADDTHGTAIMIRARNEGRSEIDLIAAMQAAHQRDFD